MLPNTCGVTPVEPKVDVKTGFCAKSVDFGWSNRTAISDENYEFTSGDGQDEEHIINLSNCPEENGFGG